MRHGPSIDPAALTRFPGLCHAVPPDMEVEPLMLQQLGDTVPHGRNSAPGFPTTHCSDGVVFLYKAYLAILDGEAVLARFDSSLLVCIPKIPRSADGQPHEALPQGCQPDLGDRQACRHRRTADNVVLSLASMEKALILGERTFGVPPSSSAVDPSIS